MDGMSGLLLAKRLKDIYGRTNIIFVTAHDEYKGGAMDLKASGYLLKPFGADDVRAELMDLRNPVSPPNPDESKGVRIQTFGNFEVFIDGNPLLITRSKAKELLAYLVDRRGASVTSAQIAAVLWEDKPYNRSLQMQTQKAISQLGKILSDAGIKDILVKGWNKLAVDVKRFDCDYYRLLERDPAAVNAYTGEYMAEYSWAEITAGALTTRIINN